jgi:spore coat protein A
MSARKQYFAAGAVFLSMMLMLTIGLSDRAVGQVPLNPATLTKYLDPLPIPGVMPETAPNYYEIGMWEVTQQLHSLLPPTRVWGYGISQATASYPAATIEARRGVPVDIRWTNNLPATHLLDYAVDHTLHMAHWMAGVPTVVHLHGGEVEPQSDGGPDSWFTQGFAETGPTWSKEVYTYANEQLPATLWYHDHVLGITRLNV